MRRLGLVLVCLAACDRGSRTSEIGSAYPPGPPVSPPPLLPAPDAEPPHIIESQSALDAASAPTVSPKGGLSSLGRLDMTNPDAKAIADKIGLPGVAVTFEVMDIVAVPEMREQGYLSVKRGDSELVQLLHDKKDVLAVVVLTPEIATTDGTKVGDTIDSVRAKHHDLKCADGWVANTVRAFVLCRSAKEKQLGYIVDDKNVITGIGHEF